MKRNNLPAIMTFIDFSNAFDSIRHDAMFKILKGYGIPLHLLGVIKAIYNSLRAKVVSPDGDTEHFKISAGVMQCDTLAPFLFVIVLDYGLRKAIISRLHIRSRLRRWKKLLNSVEVESAKVGLGINAKKTKRMTFNVDFEPILTVSGKEVGQAVTETGD